MSRVIEGLFGLRMSGREWLHSSFLGWDGPSWCLVAEDGGIPVICLVEGTMTRTHQLLRPVRISVRSYSLTFFLRLQPLTPTLIIGHPTRHRPSPGQCYPICPRPGPSQRHPVCYRSTPAPAYISSIVTYQSHARSLHKANCHPCRGRGQEHHARARSAWPGAMAAHAGD